MRRTIFLFALILTVPLFGQYRPFTGTVGSVNLTDQGFAKHLPTTAKTLASTPSVGAVIHPWAQTATVCVETQAIRWKMAGTPTAAEGMPLAAGSCITIENRQMLEAFTFIESTSGAVVWVTYGW